MHWSAEPRGDDVVTRVQGAIAARSVLNAAEGMIAAHQGISLPAAGRALADYANRHRVSLADTAQAMVSRTMEPDAILDSAAET